MNRCEQAAAYHKKGFNCCQSVLAAFQDVIGLTETQCLTLGGGFGAGAGTGELCGAVTGAVMVLDLLTPADPADVVGSKKKAMAQAKELQKRFAARFENLRSPARAVSSSCCEKSPAASAPTCCKRSSPRMIPPPPPRRWDSPATVTL